MVKNPGYYVISNGVWSVGIDFDLWCNPYMFKTKKKKKRPEIGEIVQALSQMGSLSVIIVRWMIRSWVQHLPDSCVITLKKNYQIIKNSNSIPKKKGDKKPQKLA